MQAVADAVSDVREVAPDGGVDTSEEPPVQAELTQAQQDNIRGWVMLMDIAWDAWAEDNKVWPPFTPFEADGIRDRVLDDMDKSQHDFDFTSIADTDTLQLFSDRFRESLAKVGPTALMPEADRLASGDVKLFDNTGGVFGYPEQKVLDYPSSPLARLAEVFDTRKPAKVVMMGYEGSGKTETLNLAMDRHQALGFSFDLRSWYFHKVGQAQMDPYQAFEVLSTQQLAWLKDEAVQNEIKQSCREQVAAAMRASGTNPIVAFIDEIDLVGAEVMPEDIEAMDIWLGLVNEAIGSAPVIQVAVLHPGSVARVPTIGQAVEARGFSIEEAIDFSVAYPKEAQSALVRGILTPSFEQQEDERGMTLVDYFQGCPGAFRSLLIDEGGDISRVHAAVQSGDPGLALELAKDSGMRGVARQITNDLRYDTNEAQKRAALFLYDRWPRPGQPETPMQEAALEGAAKIGSLIKAPAGHYMMSPVYHDALADILHSYGIGTLQGPGVSQ